MVLENRSWSFDSFVYLKLWINIIFTSFRKIETIYLHRVKDLITGRFSFAWLIWKFQIHIPLPNEKSYLHYDDSWRKSYYRYIPTRWNFSLAKLMSRIVEVYCFHLDFNKKCIDFVDVVTFIWMLKLLFRILLILTRWVWCLDIIFWNFCFFRRLIINDNVHVLQFFFFLRFVFFFVCVMFFCFCTNNQNSIFT